MSAPAVPRDAWLFVGIGIAAFVAILIAICRPWDLDNAFMIGAPFGRDFANFWLGGHLAINGRLDLLTDLAGYNALFQATFHHNPAESFVYSYPPHSLLFVAPLGALPFVLADALWTLGNLACLAAAAWLLSRRWPLVVVALLSPAALMMAAFGHFGGALALLATLACLRAPSRPMLAGLCLALMSVKPQFAGALALVLLLAGYWRAVAWSVPATLALVLASVAAFGWAPWIDFVRWTLPFHAHLLSDYAVEALRTNISLYAGLRLSGVPGWAAQAAQYAFGALVIGRAAMLLRAEGTTARAIAPALLAALAALPYVNGYDLAAAAPPVAVAMFAAGTRPLLTPLPGMLLWLAPVFALPFGLLALPLVPAAFAGVSLLALFGPGGDAPSEAARKGFLTARP